MKKSIFTLLFSSISLFALAQPGNVQQPAPSPLMIVNTTPHTLGFEVRTHNYAETYLPICYTYYQNLAGYSNLMYNNVNQVGIPLNTIFMNGPITATWTNTSVALTSADLYAYGTTQKWYEIKMCLLGGNLCGNLIPFFDDNQIGTTYQISGGFYKDNNGVIWNKGQGVNSSYWHELFSSDGLYTAGWAIIGNTNFVLIS